MWNHPRVCGENLIDSLTHRVAVESPRVCGENATNVLPFSDEDSPRVCGENSFSLWPSSTLAEQPPRMRGKPYTTYTFGLYA